MSGFYDHNEGVAYPLETHQLVAFGATDLDTVLVGATVSLSTVSGFDGSQAVKLTAVERTGHQKVRFTVTVDGLGIEFWLVANWASGQDVPRYSVLRALAREGGVETPELGSAALVVNRLGDLRTLALSTPQALDLPLEPSTVHLIGDAPVSRIRLANKRQILNLILHDDPVPAGTPTELIPGPRSTVSETPQVQLCEDGYEVVTETTELVDVIVYEETTETQLIDTFVDEATIEAITDDGAEDFDTTASNAGWNPPNDEIEEIYTVTITNAVASEFLATSDLGDSATGTLILNNFVPVGTRGLTARWIEGASPLADGMQWQITVRRGVFAIPTEVTVYEPVVQQISVPVYEQSTTALTLEFLDIDVSTVDPVTVDIVEGDSYAAEDDQARALSGFIDEIEEVTVFDSTLTLREGYNIDFTVLAAANRLQLNLLPGGGRGLQPSDGSVSDCNNVLRMLFGALPDDDGDVEITAGAGVLVVPEKGAHRLTVVFFEPTENGVVSCE